MDDTKTQTKKLPMVYDPNLPTGREDEFGTPIRGGSTIDPAYVSESMARAIKEASKDPEFTGKTAVVLLYIEYQEDFSRFRYGIIDEAHPKALAAAAKAGTVVHETGVLRRRDNTRSFRATAAKFTAYMRRKLGSNRLLHAGFGQPE